MVSIGVYARITKHAGKATPSVKRRVVGSTEVSRWRFDWFVFCSPFCCCRFYLRTCTRAAGKQEKSYHNTRFHILSVSCCSLLNNFLPFDFSNCSVYLPLPCPTTPLETALACLAVDPAMLLLIVGVLMFFLTFCGCVGSLRENICLLQTVSKFSVSSADFWDESQWPNMVRIYISHWGQICVLKSWMLKIIIMMLTILSCSFTVLHLSDGDLHSAADCWNPGVCLCR